MPPKYAYLDPSVRPRGRGRHVLRRTLPFFKPYRWTLVFAGVFVAFTGFTVSLMPQFTRYVINVAIPRKDFNLALLVMASFVLLMILRMASWYAGQCRLLMIRERIIFKLRTMAFSRMQELCLRFHQRYSPGYLYDRTLGAASTAVGTFLSMLFNTLVTHFCQLVFSISFCLMMHTRMTLIILAMSTGYVVISRYFGKRIHALTKTFNQKMNEFAGHVTDRLRGVTTIKAFAMEQQVISDFDQQLWPLQLRSLDINKVTMRLGFNGEGLGYFITAVVVTGCAYLVLREEIELGTMVAFITYQNSITAMLGSLSTISGAYGAAMAGLEQIYEIIDERPSVVEKKGAVMPPEVLGGIDLEQVRFSYEEKPVLRGLSLRVLPGQSIALVGPAAGGKTTLINLLLRFYDPDSGAIRLDGHDIKNLPLQGYRSLFGVVLQDPFLFNDSIYTNLKAVKPNATDDEIRDALERAQAWEFVADLKGGWHFTVGESGSQLSGGQRQRIAIARCILADPRIMILDEATSALDNQSELLVQQALHEVMKNRTVFVIAHRLSTVRHVDRVLVLQDGCIVQDGAFDQLCQAPGLFRDLYLASLEPALPETMSDVALPAETE